MTESSERKQAIPRKATPLGDLMLGGVLTLVLGGVLTAVASVALSDAPASVQWLPLAVGGFVGQVLVGISVVGYGVDLGIRRAEQRPVPTPDPSRRRPRSEGETASAGVAPSTTGDGTS